MSDYVKGQPHETAIMYCVKCNKDVVITGPERTVTKSNRDAIRGKCPHCETLTFRFVPKNK